MRRYCDIENLYRGNAIYENGPVEVTEKLHGTNIRIGVDDGDFFVGGRNTEILRCDLDEWHSGEYEVHNDGYGIVAWIRTHLSTLPQKMVGVANSVGDFMLFGEFVGKGVQKGVDYGDERTIYMFDLWKDGEWKPSLELQNMAYAFGFYTVPILYFGEPSLEVFNQLYEGDSEVAKVRGVTTSPNIREGIVIKPIKEAVDEHGNRVIFKHKNAKFAEVASQAKIKAPKDPNANAEEKEFVETFVNFPRLSHVIQQLFENDGIRVESMAHTKEVIQGMLADLRKECDLELAEVNEKEALSLAAKRTATLLKEYLAPVVV